MNSCSSATRAGLRPTLQSALSPVPIPSAMRPGAISSSENSIEAVTDGSRETGFVTADMIPIRSVAVAQYVAETPSSRAMTGESGTPT